MSLFDYRRDAVVFFVLLFTTNFYVNSQRNLSKVYISRGEVIVPVSPSFGKSSALDVVNCSQKMYHHMIISNVIMQITAPSYRLSKNNHCRLICTLSHHDYSVECLDYGRLPFPPPKIFSSLLVFLHGAICLEWEVHHLSYGQILPFNWQVLGIRLEIALELQEILFDSCQVIFVVSLSPPYRAN